MEVLPRLLNRPSVEFQNRSFRTKLARIHRIVSKVSESRYRAQECRVPSVRVRTMGESLDRSDFATMAVLTQFDAMDDVSGVTRRYRLAVIRVNPASVRHVPKPRAIKLICFMARIQWQNDHDHPAAGVGVSIPEAVGPPLGCIVWFGLSVGSLVDHPIRVHANVCQQKSAQCHTEVRRKATSNLVGFFYDGVIVHQSVPRGVPPVYRSSAFRIRPLTQHCDPLGNLCVGQVLAVPRHQILYIVDSRHSNVRSITNCLSW